MSNERVGFQPAKSESDHDQREELLWRNNEIRQAAKDLLLNVEELPIMPQSLPYRAKVIDMVNSILTIVPVLDAEQETDDERDRQQLADDSRRLRQQWKNRFR